MEQANSRKRNKRGCFDKLKLKEGFFKSPRDTSWTIDSMVNGRPNPSGYDSNSLITILRSSQCVAAVMTAILYDCTMSFPSFWLALLSATVAPLSALFSILALHLRHRWVLWLVIPEVLLTIAWIVLIVASAMSTPKDGKEGTFYLGMIAIEASTVLWIQTCLLMVTPFFHRMIPKLFGLRKKDNPDSDRSRDGAYELVSWPQVADKIVLTYTKQPAVPPEGRVYQSSVPSIACPQPTRPGPASHMRLGDYLVAHQATAPGTVPQTVPIPQQPARDRTPYAGSNVTEAVPLQRTVRTVSPLSTMHGSVRSVSPLSIRGDPREYNPWNTASVRGGEVRRARR
ncbi:hypothetical protein F4776DRAFT_113254 [Hypoxylon sp. NC0597]|nr:hypothetical protein F4776DRAFT_113254 [Hypoxylon sp. NC0597]